MTHAFNPDYIKTDKEIKDIIRASYYTGDVTSKGWRLYWDTFKISMKRLKFVTLEVSHAFTDVPVELSQLKWGQEKGYKYGHIITYFLLLVIFILIAQFFVFLYKH